MAKKKLSKTLVEKNLTVDTTVEEITNKPENELAEKPIEGGTPLVENVSEEKKEVTEEPKQEQKPVKEPEVRVLRGVVQNCTRLNIRKGPSKETEIVGVLSAGIVTVVEETESPDWYKTKKGYVMKKFIKLLVK